MGTDELHLPRSRARPIQPPSEPTPALSIADNSASAGSSHAVRLLVSATAARRSPLPTRSGHQRTMTRSTPSSSSLPDQPDPAFNPVSMATHQPTATTNDQQPGRIALASPFIVSAPTSGDTAPCARRSSLLTTSMAHHPLHRAATTHRRQHPAPADQRPRFRSGQ
ncbi:hypothetical protein ACLOJK_003987 [Asimina triloba]